MKSNSTQAAAADFSSICQNLSTKLLYKDEQSQQESLPESLSVYFTGKYSELLFFFSSSLIPPSSSSPPSLFFPFIVFSPPFSLSIFISRHDILN
ncbi:hypothetical protein INR49_003291 [Caranx melampygus]|nr:hypothetical protein INR49_003291 [Caranx melampygus]